MPWNIWWLCIIFMLFTVQMKQIFFSRFRKCWTYFAPMLLWIEECEVNLLIWGHDGFWCFPKLFNNNNKKTRYNQLSERFQLHFPEYTYSSIRLRSLSLRFFDKLSITLVFKRSGELSSEWAAFSTGGFGGCFGFFGDSVSDLSALNIPFSISITFSMVPILFSIWLCFAKHYKHIHHRERMRRRRRTSVRW